MLVIWKRSLHTVVAPVAQKTAVKPLTYKSSLDQECQNLNSNFLCILSFHYCELSSVKRCVITTSPRACLMT